MWVLISVLYLKKLYNYIKHIQLYRTLIVPMCIWTLIGRNEGKEIKCSSYHELIKYGNISYNVQWKARSNSNNIIVTSNPPCLDRDNNLVLRICTGDTWTINNSSCFAIEKNRLCPEGFLEDDKSCIFTTKPTCWNSSCPYPGASFAEVDYVEKSWFPMRRMTRFGLYEYVIPGEKYGLSSFDDLLEESSDGNCITKSKFGFEKTNCNLLFPHVCSYKYDTFLYNCPQGCVNGGLGSDYCFCKFHNNHKDCILASPRYGYERKILQKLAGNDKCLVGNVQENSNLYLLNLTPYHRLVVDKNGWNLQTNDDVNCKLCKVKPEAYLEPKLQLEYKEEKLFLLVYSPDSLLKDEEDDNVYCFTDATGRFKTKVDVKEIWKYESNNSSQPLRVLELSMEKSYPGQYWCEGFQLPDLNIVKSNTVVASKKTKGKEYALRLTLDNICSFSGINCKKLLFSDLVDIIEKIFDDHLLEKFVKHIRIMDVYHINKTKGFVDLLLHLTTKTKIPLNREYYFIRGLLERYEQKNRDFIKIVCFRNSEYCMEDTTYSYGTKLYWKSTSIGKTILPKELCVQNDTKPITRTCLGDFLTGATWSKIDGFCAKNVNFSETTHILHDLIANDSTILIENLTSLTDNSANLSIVDMYYFATIFLQFAYEEQNRSMDFIKEISDLIDHIMEVDRSLLREAQTLLKSTNQILFAFEKLSDNINVSNDIVVLRKSNLITHISKPFVNGVSGLLLKGESNSILQNLSLEHIYYNTSLDDIILRKDVEIATYMPQKLLGLMFENLTLEEKNSIKIITTVFFKDNLFVSDNTSVKKVGSKIVSVSVPGYGVFLHSPIPVVFKNRKGFSNQECVFWDFGSDNSINDGHWSTLGGYNMDSKNSLLDVCTYSHLTHFALLVMDNKISISEDDQISISYEINISTKHNLALSVITAIGSLCSLIGITGIFVTAATFKNYRSKIGTKILLQLCIAILLENILIYIANFKEIGTSISSNFCTLVGILLHYSVLSKFCWMLVTAFLQFYRFVKVLGPVPSKLILKTSIIGWFLPIIPISLVVLNDPQNYSAGTKGLCYPSGVALYLSVLLPIIVIVTANLSVFILVIQNIFEQNVQSYGQNDRILKRQLYLAVLLFFLLGLPWIFGVVAELLTDNSILQYTFMYLFCLTATIQGFILFLFYVVLDERTRSLWCSFYKNLPSSL